MLLTQANGAIGAQSRQADGALGPQTGSASQPRRGGAFAWMLSQAAPLLIRRANGRVLVWVWKDDPELLVAMAQLQEATPQVRTARAMMPMEYDDTESFRNPHLGVGERLLMPLPQTPQTPPFATYTWDAGTHFVTLTAVCSDRERFGTITGALDDLARSLRLVEDVSLGESDVLRIEPR
jgi:hypothetical protein